jgi:hypothetical protein
MKRPIPLSRGTAAVIAAFLVMLASALAQAAEPAQGYSAFRFVRTRNIFDPERRGARSDASAAAPVSQGPTTRSNFIALTGTMVTEGKTLAFFTGSRPEYSKVISVHDKIADFTITAIAAREVQLELAGKPITVVIGNQLPLQGSSAETAVPLSPMPAAEVSNAPPSGSSAVPSSPSSSSTDKSEILRRMAERREKEFSK